MVLVLLLLLLERRKESWCWCWCKFLCWGFWCWRWCSGWFSCSWCADACSGVALDVAVSVEASDGVGTGVDSGVLWEEEGIML